MKNRRIMALVLALALMAAQLSGCANAEADTDGNIIPVAEENLPDDVRLPLGWTKVGDLTNRQDFRTQMETLFTADNTNLLYDEATGNGTFLGALGNTVVENLLQDEDMQEKLQELSSKEFTDLEEGEGVAAAFYTYFDLLPDDGGSTFNGGDTLTRAEAMTLLMRATTEVEEDGTPDPNATFTAAVGESNYTDFASYVDSSCYVNSNTGLDTENFHTAMTRGEYVYAVLNSLFDTLAVDNEVELDDCKDAGAFDGLTNAEAIATAISDADAGAPTIIYDALVKAVDLGILSSETRWDEAITKAEAVTVIWRV